MDHQELNAVDMIWSWMTENGVGPIAAAKAQAQGMLR